MNIQITIDAFEVNEQIKYRLSAKAEGFGTDSIWIMHEYSNPDLIDHSAISAVVMNIGAQLYEQGKKGFITIPKPEPQTNKSK